MNIYAKFLLSTLTLVLVFTLATVATTHHISRMALTHLADTWLETRLVEAMRVAREQVAVLHNYGLEEIPASIIKAKLDAGSGMEDIEVGRGGYIFAVTADGKIALHPDKDLVGHDVRSQPWFRELQNGRGRLVFTSAMDSNLARYYFFSPWEWFIIATAPEREIYGLADRIRPYVLGLGAACTLVLAVILMFWTRHLTRPLKTLTDGAERIGQGDLALRIPVRTQDEFGQLAEVFNRMTSQLQDSLHNLQRKEQYFRSLIENASDIVAILNPEGDFIYASPSIERILGWNSQSLVGRSVFGLIHPEDRDAIRERFKKRVRNLLPSVPTEFRMQHRNGSWRALEGISEKLLDHPAVGGFVVNARDITERKLVAADLRKSEENLAKLNECLIKFTPDSIENINRLTALCGELLGATCALYNRLDNGKLQAWGQWQTPEGFNPIDNPKGHICYDVIQNGSKDVMLVSALQDSEYARTDPNVRSFGLQTYMGKAVKFFDTYIGALCVVFKEDVTPTEADKELMGIVAAAIGVEDERRRIDTALRESEEKYRTMMEAMDDATYICSSELKVEYMNPAMIKRLGRDATGEPCFQALHGLSEPCDWCIHSQVMNGEYVITEVSSPLDSKTFQISNSPIRNSDGSISKLIVFRDVTEFKEMETLLQQAQRMEAIGTLAGGIAHDFNNILFPLVGFSEMLREDLPADSHMQTYVEEILQAAMRSKELVQQILTFSRQSEQEARPIKLQPILKEVLKLLRSTIPSTIKFRQSIDPDCGVVIADATQIHQVIMNLATNAFHAMEKDGGELKVVLKTIRLEAGQTDMPALIPGNYARLAVSDTGIGIPPEIMEKVCNPYFTTKETGKGTGLGLSVVQGIAKTCNGEMRILSEPGQGTEVQVFLPLLDRKVEDAPSERDVPVPGGSESILLVDDEEAIVRMVQQMLARLGYKVAVRTGSVEALEAVRANPDRFELVITDLTMPNKTGIQLAQEIKKIRQDLPVILCTGFSDQINAEQSEAMGLQGFVMKPIIKTEIAKKIRRVLDKSAVADSAES